MWLGERSLKFKICFSTASFCWKLYLKVPGLSKFTWGNMAKEFSGIIGMLFLACLTTFGENIFLKVRETHDFYSND